MRAVYVYVTERAPEIVLVYVSSRLLPAGGVVNA